MTDTPIRKMRKIRELSIRQVAEAVGTDPSNLSRIETSHHAPPQELARKLYRFYEGELDIVDIYDPTFMDEVGVVDIENSRNAWYIVKTRVETFTVHGADGLKTLFEKLASGVRAGD